MRRHRTSQLGVSVALALSIGLAIAVASRETEPERVQRLGAALYDRHCGSCHGAELEGEANWKMRLPDGSYPAPPHDANGHTWHHDDEYLFSVTRDGGRPRGPDWPSGMPGFRQSLTDQEIRSILAFIKSTWPDPIRASQAKRNR